MTDEEKKEALLKICPELSLGLNEGDVNKGMIELLHHKLLSERQITYLADKVLSLAEENLFLRSQLLRVEPLLRAQEGGEK